MSKRTNRDRAPSKTRVRKAGTSEKTAVRGRRAPAVRRQLKFQAGDRVHVKMGAPAAYRGQTGEIVQREGTARYLVALEEGTSVPLYSWWLELVAPTDVGGPSRH